VTSAQKDERCSHIPDVGAFTVAYGHTVYRYSSDEKAVVDPPASDIEKVQGARAGTTKRTVVTMRDDEPSSQRGNGGSNPLSSAEMAPALQGFFSLRCKGRSCRCRVFWVVFLVGGGFRVPPTRQRRPSESVWMAGSSVSVSLRAQAA
jgi:hypothetical protein